MTEYKLTQAQIKAIEQTVSKGDRAEIIPLKDSLKIVRVSRKEINTTR